MTEPTEASAKAPGKPVKTSETKKAAPKKKAIASEEAPSSAKPVQVEAKSDGAAAPSPAPVAEKPMAEKKDPPPPPPPPEPGRYGQLLMANGFHPTPLGFDNGGLERIDLKPDELLAASRFLRDNEGTRFDLLVCIAGVDWKDRLEVVYHLYSTKTFDKVVLKVTPIAEKLPSVVSVWQTADWHERETYDLFGITFEGHPNLKRILLPSDWIGYPLRKDYKMEDPRLVWNER